MNHELKVLYRSVSSHCVQSIVARCPGGSSLRRYRALISLMRGKISSSLRFSRDAKTCGPTIFVQSARACSKKSASIVLMSPIIRKKRRGTETILRRRRSSKDAFRFQIEVINGENEDFFAVATIALVFQERVECLAKTLIGPVALYVVPSLLLVSSYLDQETAARARKFPSHAIPMSLANSDQASSSASRHAFDAIPQEWSIASDIRTSTAARRFSPSSPANSRSIGSSQRIAPSRSLRPSQPLRSYLSRSSRETRW